MITEHISKILYKSDTDRYFLEKNLLLENVNQAIKFLKEKNLDPDTTDKGRKIFDEIRKITRGDGFTNLMVMFHVNDRLPLEEVQEIYDYLKKNRSILNQLPKPVVNYENYNTLNRDILEFESKRVSVRLYNELPRDLKNQYDRLDERNKIFFKQLATKFYKLPQDRQEGFNLKKVGTFETIDEFIQKLNNYLVSIEEGIDFKTTQEKIESTDGAVVIYANEDEGILISNILTFSASQVLGCTTEWCISTTQKYWREYKMGGNYYFFIWDYNKHVTDKEFLISTAYDNKYPGRSETYNSPNNKIDLLTTLSKKNIDIKLLDNYIENNRQLIRKNVTSTPIIDLIKNGPEEELIEAIAGSNFFETYGGNSNDINIYSTRIELNIDSKKITEFYDIDDDDMSLFRSYQGRYNYDSYYVDDDEYNYMHSYISEDNKKLLTELSKKFGVGNKFDFWKEGQIYKFSEQFSLDIEEVFRDEYATAKEVAIQKEIDELEERFIMDVDNGTINTDKLLTYITEKSKNPQNFDDIVEIIIEAAPDLWQISEIEYQNHNIDWDNLNKAIGDKIEAINDNIEDHIGDVDEVDVTYDDAINMLEKLGYKQHPNKPLYWIRTPEKNIFLHHFEYNDNVLHVDISIVYKKDIKSQISKPLRGWVTLRRLIDITQHYTLLNIDESKTNKLKKIINEEIGRLSEDYESSIKRLDKIGYKLVDKKEANEYILFLVREPQEGLYEIGITSNNREFSTSVSQEKIPGGGSGKEHSTANIFKKTITQWLTKYNPIYVGSLNKNKTLKYYNILGRLGFDVTTIEHDDPVVINGNEVFPESWNFKIGLKR